MTFGLLGILHRVAQYSIEVGRLTMGFRPYDVDLPTIEPPDDGGVMQRDDERQQLERAIDVHEQRLATLRAHVQAVSRLSNAPRHDRPTSEPRNTA